MAGNISLVLDKYTPLTAALCAHYTGSAIKFPVEYLLPRSECERLPDEKESGRVRISS